MAVVYLAEDLRQHRTVALKALRPELAAMVGSDRFLREIAIIGELTTRTSCRCSTRAKPGSAVLCHALHRGRDAAGQVAAREAAGDRGRAGDHPGNCRCAVLRTRVRCHPSRHQARRTSCCRAGTHSSPTSGLGGPSAQVVAGITLRDGRGDWNCRLHEPEQGVRRRRCGRTERPIRPGLRPLRDAGRSAAVRGTDCAGGDCEAAGGPGAADSHGAEHGASSP